MSSRMAKSPAAYLLRASAAVGRIIGLAYVLPHQAEPGRPSRFAWTAGKWLWRALCRLPFYDPRNERQQHETARFDEAKLYFRSFHRPRLGASAGGAGGAKLRLFDLSFLPRWGIKGRGALSWLSAAGAATPAADNRAQRQRDGSLIVQLSPGEALCFLRCRRSVTSRRDDRCVAAGRPRGLLSSAPARQPLLVYGYGQ